MLSSQQDIVKSSFFDDIAEPIQGKEEQKTPQSEKPALWLNQEQYLNITQNSGLLSSKVMCQGYLHRQDPNADQLDKYYFVLYDNRLECYENSKKEKQLGIMRLTGTKLEYSNGQDEDQVPFFFFSHNKYYDILVASTLEIFNTWLDQFRQVCVLTLFGKSYHNKKVIGKGTFAKVLLCNRLSDNKEFAVKTFDKKNIMNSKQANRTLAGLHNEISIMRQLKHPNIINLHEVYEGEFHVYLVLDLLTGGELFDKLIKKGTYTEKEAAICISKLLSALEYIHSKGIMHRDIKPENLILRSDKDDLDILLADFGLSESQHKKNLLFKRCGTPGYVAPEILADFPYDTKVDVFSAGVILYILLTGFSPFYGKSYNEILSKNRKCEIQFDVEGMDKRLSKESIELLKLMLKRNPKERITSAQALQHEWVQKHIGQEQQQIQNQSPVEIQNQGIPQNIQDLARERKINLKAVKPQGNVTDSNQMIMNSPLITGKRDSIQGTMNSPLNSPLNSPSGISPGKKQIDMRKKALMLGAKDDNPQSVALTAKEQKKVNEIGNKLKQMEI